MTEPVVAILLVLLVVLAVSAIWASDLLPAVVALGGYGFVMALIWAAIGAVDVAFTEAVVGAGATTVFMLAALLRTSRRRSPAPERLRGVAFVLLLLVGLAIASAERTLPPFGDPAAPSSVHVSPRYLEGAVEEMDTPNVVTAVLADYRSYDTLMETVVIFTAGLAAWLLLRRSEPR